MTDRRRTIGRVLKLLFLTTLLVLVAQRLMRLAATPAGAGIALNASLVGLPVPPVPLRTDTGATRLSMADGNARVVLIYSPRCPACVELRPVWERLADEAPGSVEVLGVSIDPGDTSRFLSHPRIATVRAASPHALRGGLPYRGVPTTVVISGDARTLLWVEGTFSTEGIELIRRATDR